MKRTELRIALAIILMIASTVVASSNQGGEKEQVGLKQENTVSGSSLDVGIPVSINGHAWLKGFEGNWHVWVCKPPEDVRCASWRITIFGAQNVVIDPDGHTVGPVRYAVALYQEVEGGVDGTEYWFNEADYVE